METKTFKKIFVKSAEDLPKEYGNYFIKNKNGMETMWIYHPKTDTNSWLTNIDWYLKPVDLRPVGKEGIIEGKYNDMLLYTFSVHDNDDGEDRKDRTYISLKAPSAESAQRKLIEMYGDTISDILFLNDSIPMELPGFNYPESIATELSEVKEVKFICPNCESDDAFTVTQNHHKCRKCGKRYCTDVDGNRKSYASLDEVNPVQSNVTDILESGDFYELMQQYRFVPIDSLSRTVKAFENVKEWLRSRLQPAVAYNIGLQFSDNLADLINCIKAYDKTAPLEEKGRYFEAIQREFEKIQPAVTDEQIEKWAEIASTRKEWDGFPTINLIAKRLRIEGAKAMRDGKIAEYIKNLK
jgi:predicted RNA-binding Zn-ribbon protein involved in translation (DUF1610 family)